MEVILDIPLAQVLQLRLASQHRVNAFGSPNPNVGLLPRSK